MSKTTPQVPIDPAVLHEAFLSFCEAYEQGNDVERLALFEGVMPVLYSIRDMLRSMLDEDEKEAGEMTRGVVNTATTHPNPKMREVAAMVAQKRLQRLHLRPSAR